jgi:hypothetical protein
MALRRLELKMENDAKLRTVMQELERTLLNVKMCPVSFVTPFLLALFLIRCDPVSCSFLFYNALMNSYHLPVIPMPAGP